MSSSEYGLPGDVANRWRFLREFLQLATAVLHVQRRRRCCCCWLLRGRCRGKEGGSEREDIPNEKPVLRGAGGATIGDLLHVPVTLFDSFCDRDHIRHPGHFPEPQDPVLAERREALWRIPPAKEKNQNEEVSQARHAWDACAAGEVTRRLPVNRWHSREGRL